MYALWSIKSATTYISTRNMYMGWPITYTEMFISQNWRHKLWMDLKHNIELKKPDTQKFASCAFIYINFKMGKQIFGVISQEKDYSVQVSDCKKCRKPSGVLIMIYFSTVCKCASYTGIIWKWLIYASMVCMLSVCLLQLNFFK